MKCFQKVLMHLAVISLISLLLFLTDMYSLAVYIFFPIYSFITSLLFDYYPFAFIGSFINVFLVFDYFFVFYGVCIGYTFILGLVKFAYWAFKKD